MTSSSPPAQLALPKLPPVTPEVRRLRQEGVHVHDVCFDSAAERERQARVAALAWIPSRRAVTWYWWACTLADWYGGAHSWSESALRQDLDRTGQFPRWDSFEREAIQQPLAELHAHADFRVHYQVERRGGKVVNVRFTLQKPESIEGPEPFPLRLGAAEK